MDDPARYTVVREVVGLLEEKTNLKSSVCGSSSQVAEKNRG